MPAPRTNRPYKTLLTRYQSSATVKFMFPLLLGAIFFLSANTISSTQSSYIRLEADTTAVRANERFTVKVLANAHVPVNAVDVTLRFDPQDFEVVSVDRGQSVLTIWTEEPIITNNSVTLRGGTFRRGFLGEHIIASLVLVPKQSGQSEFGASDVTLLAGDGRGTPIKVSEVNDSTLSLYIYDENESPSDIGASVEVRRVTDLDNDGQVTLRDISAFMSAWVSRGTVHDFDGDGRMTFRDFSIILANFFLR